MNKSAMSLEVVDYYSQLIDPSPSPLLKKPKYKKRMFAKIKKEERQEVLIERDVSVGLYKHLDSKLTGRRLP
jgi:hypothetical protein